MDIGNTACIDKDICAQLLKLKLILLQPIYLD